MKEFVTITLDVSLWRATVEALVERRIQMKEDNSPQEWIDTLKECIDEINRKLEPKLEGYSFEVGV